MTTNKNDQRRVFAEELDRSQQLVREAYYPSIPPKIFGFMSVFLFFIGAFAS